MSREVLVSQLRLFLTPTAKVRVVEAKESESGRRCRRGRMPEHVSRTGMPASHAHDDADGWNGVQRSAVGMAATIHSAES